MMQVKARYYPWADFVRVLATWMVIQLHVSGNLLYKWGDIHWHYWMAGNLYDSSVRASVPLFFMLSGALLLGKREPLHVFFRKRISKILYPFLLWSFLYWLWFFHLQSGDYPSLKDFETFLFSLPSNPAYSHLWFFYPLIGLYLFTPLFRFWNGQGAKLERYYFLTLWFLLGPVILIIKYFLGVNFCCCRFIDLSFASQPVLLASGYFFAGYMLREIKLTPRRVLLAGMLFGLMILLTAAGVYALTVQSGTPVLFLYDYYTPNIVLMSASAFVLFRAVGEWLSKTFPSFFAATFSRLAPLTFGVYLVHFMILDTLADGIGGVKISAMRLLYPRYHIAPYYSVPIATLVVFVLSFLVTAVLRKTPLRNYLAP